ncbi:MAG: hypothetical protein P8078_10365, partial [bacterium]
MKKKFFYLLVLMPILFITCSEDIDLLTKTNNDADQNITAVQDNNIIFQNILESLSINEKNDFIKIGILDRKTEKNQLDVMIIYEN